MADQFPKPANEAETTHLLQIAEKAINARLREHQADPEVALNLENSQLVYVGGKNSHMVLIISDSGNDRADGIRLIEYFEQGHRFEISPRLVPEGTHLGEPRTKGGERKRKNLRDSHNIV
jgi:hypothetical protein